MAYMGIADSIVGLTSYLYLLRRWKTSVVSTYAYINPVVGILLSALLLSERITMAKTAGMLVILASVFIIQREDWLRGLLLRKAKRVAD
jgi:drug/metabolite transporter (DMT)-like permease